VFMGQLQRTSVPGVHGVCTKRAFATFLARPTRIAEPTWLGYAVSNGRTWDRTRGRSQLRGSEMRHATSWESVVEMEPDRRLANSVGQLSGVSPMLAETGGELRA
jgi:hypothetical protein